MNDQIYFFHCVYKGYHKEKYLNYRKYSMNIFNDGPLLPIIGNLVFYQASILGCIIYAGLFQFSFSQIIQKFYAYLTGSNVFKVQSFIYIINIPAIVLIISGIFFNKSLFPVDVAFKMDEIYILIVSGYICYV